MNERSERCIVVAGLLQLNNGILLMRQRDAGAAEDRWAVPTGTAEAGELLTDTLTRVLEAHVGLHAEQIGQPVCISQLCDSQTQTETLYFVLEVKEWTGKMGAGDCAGQTREMGFFHVEDAVRKLRGAAPTALYEPLDAVLRSDAPSGAFWLYRECGDGHECVHGPHLTTDADVRI